MAKPKPPVVKVSSAEAFRDIVVASMTKGLLIPLALCFALVILAYRMPADHIPGVLPAVFESLAQWQLLGWGVAATLGFGWKVHVRFLDRHYKAENQRLGEQNTSLHREIVQTKSVQQRLPSN